MRDKFRANCWKGNAEIYCRPDVPLIISERESQIISSKSNVPSTSPFLRNPYLNLTWMIDRLLHSEALAAQSNNEGGGGGGVGNKVCALQTTQILCGCPDIMGRSSMKK